VANLHVVNLAENFIGCNFVGQARYAVMNGIKSTTDAKRRTVRSFVRRTGRMTPGQERALTELWPQYGLDFSLALLSLPDVFGRSAPVVLEIGFGNGESLVSQAAASPELDYIGIEVHQPGVGHCMLRARNATLTNLRVICHDAIDVLQEYIPDQALSRVNLYFPDPWPKKKHHKRRIVQTAFLQLVADRLQPGGALHIATDWANYAEHIDEVLDQSHLFRVDERREHAGDDALDRPTSRFERRGLEKGHRIFDWRLIRI
jgi:tRNA (guanine-N7-)-methyltransferase